MDMKIVKIIDIIISENNETGEIETNKIYLPTIIDKKDIENISPYISSKGKLYKNVSMIKTYTGENITLVGNYITINNSLNIKKNKIGFNINKNEK